MKALHLLAIRRSIAGEITLLLTTSSTPSPRRRRRRRRRSPGCVASPSPAESTATDLHDPSRVTSFPATALSFPGHVDTSEAFLAPFTSAYSCTCACTCTCTYPPFLSSFDFFFEYGCSFVHGHDHSPPTHPRDSSRARRRTQYGHPQRNQSTHIPPHPRVSRRP